MLFNNTGDNWENSQEMLAVNTQSFEEFLQKKNLFPFWSAFQINSTTVEAAKLPGYAHSQIGNFALNERRVHAWCMGPLQKFDGIKDAARAVGVNSTSIIGVLRGKQVTCRNFERN